MKGKSKHIHCVSRLLLAVGTLFSCGGNKESKEAVAIAWDNGLCLPPCEGMAVNKGLAGAFAGIIDDVLVLAGGANFPEAEVWNGGLKVWWSTLYHTELCDGKEQSKWTVKENFLPAERAYGLSVALDDEILCIGGCDKDACYADVFSITKNDEGEIVVKDKVYPPLPIPLANMAGTRTGTMVFVAGGQETMKNERSTKHFFCLDTKHPEAGWNVLPGWPGPSRAYAVCASQGGKVYLFSGRSFAPDTKTIVLDDAYAYDPVAESWECLPGKYDVMAGTAVSLASDKIVLLGGVQELLPATPGHPGFSKQALVFDVNDHSLVLSGLSPFPIPVTCHAISKDNGFYIASGETKPGVRTPHILHGKWCNQRE